MQLVRLVFEEESPRNIFLVVFALPITLILELLFAYSNVYLKLTILISPSNIIIELLYTYTPYVLFPYFGFAAALVFPEILTFFIYAVELSYTFITPSITPETPLVFTIRTFSIYVVVLFPISMLEKLSR